MSETKPREWTVKKDRVLVYEDDNQRNYEVIQIAEGELVNNGEKVKVIEYSAYEHYKNLWQEFLSLQHGDVTKIITDVEQSRLKIQRLEARIQKLREALKDIHANCKSPDCYFEECKTAKEALQADDEDSKR